MIKEFQPKDGYDTLMRLVDESADLYSQLPSYEFNKIERIMMRFGLKWDGDIAAARRAIQIEQVQHPVAVEFINRLNAVLDSIE